MSRRAIPWTPLLIAVGLWVLAAVLVGPLFTRPINQISLARQFAVDAPLVVGQAVVLIAGGLDISIGAVLAMSGALAIDLQPYGLGISVGAALLFGVAIGALNGFLVVKAKIHPFIATLGTMSLVRGILLTYTGQQSIPGSNPSFAQFGNASLGVMPLSFLIVVALVVVAQGHLRSTRWGRHMYAVGHNADAAYVAGVLVERLVWGAFILSGLLAAFSGVLLAARLNASSVQVGYDTPILVLSAAIIGGASLRGGRGDAVGAFLGLAALAILRNAMNMLGVATYHQIGVQAAVLVVVVAVDAWFTSQRRVLSWRSLQWWRRRPDALQPQPPSA
jgi:ribose transport system permease protein